MERKIVRHAVGAAAHDAALDTEFRPGQRVVTIDGVAGRIQFVTGSFAPGVAEYQVVLDNGMGGGTYTASQLRPVPDSYRAPSGPHANLPAGVTAAIEAEAGEIHLASEDYPEMGSVLHDRPDPAGQFQVIGSRHHADAYAQGHDERDDDENGGEADVGMYWEAPANQQWRDENLGEPPEPQIQDVPGYGQEDFEKSFGKISTTINGTEIDGHGDAPGHGSRPRAQDPDAYDGESTEGQGDPRADKPLSGMDDEAGRGATAGMFPSGVSAGDGFGMSFGAAFGQDQGNWDAWNDYAADQKPDPHPDHDTDDDDEQGYPEEHLQTESSGSRTASWGEDMAGHLRDVHGIEPGGDDEEMDEAHWHEHSEDPGHVHQEHLNTFAPLDLRGGEHHPQMGDIHRPFTDHLIHSESSRVPWTGHQRTELHGWDNGAGASEGDFVPSGNFTGRHPLQPHEELSEPAVEVIEQQLQSQAAVHPDIFCAVRHGGPCRFPEPLRVHGESLRHPRPRGFTSEIHPVDADTRALSLRTVGLTPTHVLKGYQHGQHVGSLHYQQSDDGKAAYVTNLESHKAEGHGVGSALMDDLYSHAHRSGMWINHGQRTPEGLNWWNSYREPYPEHNVHNAMPNQGIQASSEHPGVKSWQHYWDPREVAADMHFHSEVDPAGKHEPPRFNPHLYDETTDYKRHWKGSTAPSPKKEDPFADEAERDAKRDMNASGHGADEYHGWGELAHTGAASSQDHHYARHLMDAHGYSEADVERVRVHGLHDMHGVLHQSGLANHRHEDLAAELAAGARRHRDSQVADQFGQPYSRPRVMTTGRPEKGGAAGEYDHRQTSGAGARLPEDPARQHAFYSSRTTEAGVRVRTNGPNDFTFHHVPDDSEDPSNSLDEGDPGEDTGLDDDLDNGLDERGPRKEEAPGQPPAGEDTDEDDGEVAGPGEEAGNEPPGNLPAGVQPPAKPSGRPPDVPQHPSVPPETWPLATAPVQERPLPLSQGGKPSPSTRRSNPVKLELPGAGGGAEVDGEKPGSEDKGGAKEAALAAFTAAAGSQSFRFEFTAGWRDVVAKAKRLRKGGRVRITHVSAGLVIGEVGGDHDVYEAGIQRPPGRPQTIQHWACGCPWASFHQDGSYPGRLNGRPCSHVYALQLEASSRAGRSRTGEPHQDPSADELGVPHQVVVKSMPPWGAGGWAQTWLAPSASKLAGRHERPEPAEWADAPEDDTDWEFYETDDPADNPWGQGRHRRPAHEAALALLAAGEPAQDVELLARTAGIDLAAAANDPWGDSNYAEHPPAKPYGATSPRDPSQNPANTGPLSGPDPEDWAEIPDTGLSQPMTATSSLPGLDQPGPAVQDSPDGAVPYACRVGAAGPATPVNPADPEGLSVDAALDPDEQGAGYERHLIEQHGVPADWATRWDHEKHLRDHDEVNQMSHRGDPLPEGYQPHPYHQTEWEHRQEPGSWPDAGHSHSFTGSSVRLALTAGLAELEANAVGEAERLRAGIDGTMGDAQDVPHAFHGNTPYCQACGLNPEAGVHQRDGAQAELHTTPEPALPEATADASQYALDPAATGGGPGMSTGDEDLSPEDTSIQTMGADSSGGSDSMADESFSVSPQETGAEAYADDPVTQFQATAAGRQYAGGGQPAGDGDLAAAARAHLAKTADVLPDHEAAALISEGRGTRARNLSMLQLEGTHYEGIDDEVGKRGLSLDDYDDDLVVL